MENDISVLYEFVLF